MSSLPYLRHRNDYLLFKRRNGKAGKWETRRKSARDPNPHCLLPSDIIASPKTEGRDRGGMEMQKGSKVEKERAGQFLPHVKWMDSTLHRLPHSRSGKTAVNTKRKFRQWLSYDELDGWPQGRACNMKIEFKFHPQRSSPSSDDSGGASAEQREVDLRLLRPHPPHHHSRS